ncbi:MAG: hypothetical protein U9Q40_02995 [Campylobacterota bacterium]|nr:hypothetical protein [Campylobacterota bacterium]
MRKNLSILLLISATMLSGCASKKVHVHTQDSAPTKVKKTSKTTKNTQNTTRSSTKGDSSCKDCLPTNAWYE